MNDKYIIKLFDTPMVSFEFTSEGLEDFGITDVTLLTKNQELLPLDLTLTAEGVASWLRRRVIPKNREFVHNILRAFGLSVNNTKGIIDVCKGLSLNDSYWVVKDDFNGAFSQYNLYQNPFSEVLGLIAYTGVGATDPAFTIVSFPFYCTKNPARLFFWAGSHACAPASGERHKPTHNPLAFRIRTPCKYPLALQ